MKIVTARSVVCADFELIRMPNIVNKTVTSCPAAALFKHSHILLLFFFFAVNKPWSASFPAFGTLFNFVL